jgi:1,4-dihydroxy-2-naphthoate octaprenyltransferase
VAAVAGLALAATTSWWLLLVGAAAIAAAWFYTGGPRPYGYAGLGELFVFVFFGLVAVCGTTYVQLGRLTALSVAVAVAVGLLACALLVANNLRDVPTDGPAGKRTLAVRLGTERTRALYVGLVAVPFALPVVLAVAGHPAAVVALAAAALAVRPVRLVAGGAVGRDLVPVLRDTGRLELAYTVLLALALAVG